MTDEQYFPLYSLGEILVQFKDSVGEDFAATFGTFLGYNLVESWEHGNNVFVYRTDVHQEEEAIRTFLGKTEFVEWANRRDIRLEGRWVSLESAIAALEELRDNCEIPKGEYERRLEEIKERLR